MSLPAALRQAVERVLENAPAAELAKSSEALSRRYRDDVQDGRAHVADASAARAYLAARMPATFAAIRASLAAAAQAQPEFEARSVLDLGSGPGTALWAASECWPAIRTAVLVEASAAMRACGTALGAPHTLATVEWIAADLGKNLPMLAAHDLVTMTYVLGELASAARDDAIDAAWSLTAGALAIVEPGTPAGWARVLAARARLIAHGAHLLAPCPHAAPCPLSAPDWCHFSRRLPRSRLHRQAKSAEAPFEDEKYIYLVASRRPGLSPQARVIARPRTARGQVRLKLCTREGEAVEAMWTRRDGEPFKAARRLDWGDGLPRADEP